MTVVFCSGAAGVIFGYLRLRPVVSVQKFYKNFPVTDQKRLKTAAGMDLA
ncbi:hypothetical protein [Pedomonas sp. V897]